MTFFDPIDTDNINFVYLKKIFIELFGDDFQSEFNLNQIQTLLDNIYRFEGITNIGSHENQFHALYLIGHTLHKYNNENINLETSSFYDDFYFPNMVSILSSNMTDAKRILNNVMRKSYDEVKEKCQDIVDFYLVFFKKDHITIKNDILNMFMNTIFLDNDPYNTGCIREYYSSSFRYLLYTYLKTKTSEHTSFEIDSHIEAESKLICTSPRYKIYEEGIRLSQIEELCKDSQTDNRIIKNFKKFRTDMVSNELQRFYLYSTTKTATTDNRINLLATFTDDDGLNFVKQNQPLIYKLLRSIHVANKPNEVSNDFKLLLYKSVYEVLFLEFSKNVSREISISLADDIAKRMSNSLTIGQYIDPITLDSVPINSHSFIVQIKSFLEAMLKYVN